MNPSMCSLHILGGFVDVNEVADTLRGAVEMYGSQMDRLLIDHPDQGDK